MDAFAAGLIVAAKMHEDKYIENLVADRYSSFGEGIGKEVGSDNATLATFEEHSLDMPQSELIAATRSDHMETVKVTINNYIVNALASK